MSVFWKKCLKSTQYQQLQQLSQDRSEASKGYNRGPVGYCDMTTNDIWSEVTARPKCSLQYSSIFDSEVVNIQGHKGRQIYTSCEPSGGTSVFWRWIVRMSNDIKVWNEQERSVRGRRMLEEKIVALAFVSRRTWMTGLRMPITSSASGAKSQNVINIALQLCPNP